MLVGLSDSTDWHAASCYAVGDSIEPAGVDTENFEAFLAAMDQTITAIALPTIIRDIGGESGYSWAGTAYLLGSTCNY